jgi:hypothetical protein
MPGTGFPARVTKCPWPLMATPREWLRRRVVVSGSPRMVARLTRTSWGLGGCRPRTDGPSRFARGHNRSPPPLGGDSVDRLRCPSESRHRRWCTRPLTKGDRGRGPAGLTTHAIESVDIPRSTFCTPNVASFGLTEQQVRDAGHDVGVGDRKYGRARQLNLILGPRKSNQPHARPGTRVGVTRSRRPRVPTATTGSQSRASVSSRVHRPAAGSAAGRARRR